MRWKMSMKHAPWYMSRRITSGNRTERGFRHDLARAQETEARDAAAPAERCGTKIKVR